MQEGDGKEEQIENLSNGLHSDNDPSLQPANSYRQGLNGNLITKDGNHYSYESVKGTEISFILPTHIEDSVDLFTPIGIIAMGRYLIVLSTNNSVTGGDGEIGLVTIDDYGNGTYQTLYYHADLNFSKTYMVGNECFGFVENSVMWRAYWTDDFNQPKTINAANPIFTTYIADGDIVNGTSYMVITDTFGYITYNGIDYGPMLPDGNIFIGTANPNYAVAFGQNPKVIETLNPNALNYTPEKSSGQIEFSKYLLTGQLYCGCKLYAYRLSTDDGFVSSWTFTTNPIHVAPNNPADGFQNYVGGGASGLLITNKAIELTVSDLPMDIFSNIEVAVIETDEELGVIRNIEIFWDSDITAEEMTIIHYGQEALGTLLIDDLVLRDAVVIKAKTIAFTKQRQIMANLTQAETISDTQPNATVTPFTYSFPADQQPYYGAGSTFGFSTDLNSSAGIASGDIVEFGMYLVKGTAGVDHVIYPIAGTQYEVGESFVGTNGNLTYDVDGTAATVKACIRIGTYVSIANGQQYK